MAIAVAQHAMKVGGAKPSPQELIARAAGIGKLARECAEETERNRTVSPELIAKMRDAELFRILQPARFGGFEYGYDVFIEAVAAVSAGDGSTGWVYSLGAVHGWLIGCFTDRAQHDVWDENPHAIAAVSYAPTGTATAVEGGYRIAGRWSFASGCDNAHWVIIAGLLPRADGGKAPGFVLVPKSDYKIDDDWFTMGLAGTGSKTIVVEDAFVPTIFFPDKLPLEQITLVAPFLTTDIELLDRVMNRLHQTIPAFPAQYTKFNQIRLGGTGADSFELLTTFPVKKFEDIKGRKIGTAGAALAWLRGTGATPVQSNMMEYYNSTKNGVFEGFIVFPSTFPAMKYPEAAPYVTKVGFGAQYSVVLTMNKDSFGKLPPTVQKIFLEVGQQWGIQSDKAYMTAGEAGYKSLQKFNAHLFEFPQEERKKWADAMPNIAKEWAASMEKQGLPGNQALSALMNEARKDGIKPVRDWDRE